MTKCPVAFRSTGSTTGLAGLRRRRPIMLTDYADECNICQWNRRYVPCDQGSAADNSASVNAQHYSSCSSGRLNA